jgi:hypothetical protein
MTKRKPPARRVCGGDLRVETLGGMALFTTNRLGRKTYKHRCELCGRIAELPSIGGECRALVRPADVLRPA